MLFPHRSSEETKPGFLKVVPLNEEEIITGKTETKKWHHKIDLKWLVPSLKTLGRFDKIFLQLTDQYLSEKKVLPSLMLAIAIIYFGVAAFVYLD